MGIDQQAAGAAWPIGGEKGLGAVEALGHPPVAGQQFANRFADLWFVIDDIGDGHGRGASGIHHRWWR